MSVSNIGIDTDIDVDEHNEQETTVYIVYWDCLGFECVINVTDMYEDYLLSKIQDKKYTAPVNLTHLKLRARMNSQRSPEIWSFRANSGISEEDIKSMANNQPQLLVDFIRKNGHCFFRTAPQKQVIF